MHELRRILLACCSAVSATTMIVHGADLASPFLGATTPLVAAPVTLDPFATLEFAGVFTTGEEVRVCLVDTRSSRGRWLVVGVAEDGLLAESYDTARGAVFVRAGDRTRWLELRRGIGMALPVARLADGSVDWVHMKLSTKEKETEAMYLMQDIMNVSADARAGTLKAIPTAAPSLAGAAPATTSPLR